MGPQPLLSPPVLITQIQVTQSPGDDITGPRAPNARHQAPGSDRCQAPGSDRRQAPGTGHQAPAAGNWAPDAGHLVSQAHRAPDTGHQAPGSDRRQEPGSRHQAPSSRYQAPGTGYWEPGFDWSDDPLDTGHLAPETRYQAPGTDSEHDVKSDSEEPEVPQTLTDNLSAIQLLLPDQIPISIRPPGTRRIRSLVQVDEEQSESRNLLSLPMKEVREMWAHSRQRLAVSSVQDWGLAALQSAVEHAQSLPTDGSAAEQLEAKLASLQQQIFFLGRTWLDGMSSDIFLSTRLHGALSGSRPWQKCQPCRTARRRVCGLFP